MLEQIINIEAINLRTGETYTNVKITETEWSHYISKGDGYLEAYHLVTSNDNDTQIKQRLIINPKYIVSIELDDQSEAD